MKTGVVSSGPAQSSPYDFIGGKFDLKVVYRIYRSTRGHSNSHQEKESHLLEQNGIKVSELPLGKLFGELLNCNIQRILIALYRVPDRLRLRYPIHMCNLLCQTIQLKTSMQISSQFRSR